MTSSVEEVRAMLLGAVDHLGAARGHAGVAHGRIVDAMGLLAGLGDQHPEPLVPPELARAAAELDHGLGLIGAGADRVVDIAARL